MLCVEIGALRVQADGRAHILVVALTERDLHLGRHVLDITQPETTKVDRVGTVVLEGTAPGLGVSPRFVRPKRRTMRPITADLDHRPQLAAGNHFGGALEAAVEPLHEPDHQDFAGGRGGPLNRPAFREGARHRFFHQNVQARFQGGYRLREMELDRRGDDGRLDAIGERLPQAGGRPALADRIDQCGGVAAVRVVDPDQFEAVATGQRRRVHHLRPGRAGADDRQPERHLLAADEWPRGRIAVWRTPDA